jgi:23S rRNA pseudouridine1911/1915/1917 synthase
MTTTSHHQLDAGADTAGQRLDVFLSQALPDFSRSRLKALILDGRLTRGGQTIADPAYRVKPGERFDLALPEVRPATPKGQAIALSVVYEDEALIVIDKPAGMVVHPAPGNPDRTLVNALIAHCGASLSGIGGERRPGIVHRLDKDTSGLLVAAKSDAAHHGLAEQFAAHSLTRAYQALVWGVLRPARGEIEGNIGRSPRNRKKMAIVTRGGKQALTHYHRLETFGEALACLAECRLSTGRTHQIRVHLTSIGHPVIGDPVYGRGRRRAATKEASEAVRTALAGFPRQALHAGRLGFRHPINGRELEFESALPDDMAGLLATLRAPSTG